MKQYNKKSREPKTLNKEVHLKHENSTFVSFTFRLFCFVLRSRDGTGDLGVISTIL